MVTHPCIIEFSLHPDVVSLFLVLIPQDLELGRFQGTAYFHNEYANPIIGFLADVLPISVCRIWSKCGTLAGIASRELDNIKVWVLKEGKRLTW